jgi:hypothetical protein
LYRPIEAIGTLRMWLYEGGHTAASQKALAQVAAGHIVRTSKAGLLVEPDGSLQKGRRAALRMSACPPCDPMIRNGGN